MSTKQFLFFAAVLAFIAAGTGILLVRSQQVQSLEANGKAKHFDLAYYVALRKFSQILNTEYAVSYVNEASNTLRFNGQTLNIQAAQVSTTAMVYLSNMAKTMTCTSTCNTETVTALRVYYGAEQGAMKLLYQPLLLCQTTTNYVGSGLDRVGTYTVCNTGRTYTYSGTAFMDATSSNTAIAVDTYTMGITIAKDGTLQRHSAADATSAVFSFAQILEICDEPGNDSVKFWNAVVSIRPDYYEPLHTLILSENKAIQQGNRLAPRILQNSTLFSDMAHICPPRCDVFTFPIE